MPETRKSWTGACELVILILSDLSHHRVAEIDKLFSSAYSRRMATEQGSGAAGLQFDKVESTAPSADRTTCAVCKLEIGDSYYAINGHVVCPRCKQAVEESRQSGFAAGRFFLAALYGVGAAALGAVLWYAVEKITGW